LSGVLFHEISIARHFLAVSTAIQKTLADLCPHLCQTHKTVPSQTIRLRNRK